MWHDQQAKSTRRDRRVRVRGQPALRRYPARLRHRYRSGRRFLTDGRQRAALRRTKRLAHVLIPRGSAGRGAGRPCLRQSGGARSHHCGCARARRARHRRETADGVVRRWHGRFPRVRGVHAECSGRCACEYRSHAGGGSQIQGHDLVRRELGVCACYPEGARDHREDRRPGIMDARGRSSLGLAQQGLWLLAFERRWCPYRQGCAPADRRALPQAGRRSRAQRPADPSGSRQRAHAFSDQARRFRRPRFPAHRLSRRRGLFVDPCGVRGRHRGRHLRLRDRHGRHPQLARGDGQQSPRGVQHQSQHGDADLQPVRSPVPRHLCGRENRHQAGLGPYRARRGFHHRLSPGDRGVLSRSRHWSSRPRAMAGWLPTASRRSTAPTFRPSAKAPRWRCARSEAGRPFRARSRTGRGCRAA